MKRTHDISTIIFFSLALLIVPAGFAQEDNGEDTEQEIEAPAETESRKPPEPLTPEKRRLQMEINTATLAELAAMCRRLGLSEGGDANSLRTSLRNHYVLPFPSVLSDQESKRKVISIESARSTEYFKIEEVNEEYARLTGDVKVRLRDGDAIHDISAWDILFNRTRNIITAKGNVEYKKTDGDKIETFRGDSITVNIDNWESIFLGGISEKALSSDNTTYLFSGTVISRDDEDVTILSQGSIKGTGEESLWSLGASRIWLLPGSDFAMFNAVLKVGEIPVLYIPFFYYPADEVVFHPVIGYRKREGNFLQTTTYVFGKRRTSSSASQSSLTKIMGNSTDMEKKREGIFLRSTGRIDQTQSPVNFRVMLDYYSNLGAYMGADLLTPTIGILNPIEFDMGLGFSRTVGMDGAGNFTPFPANYNGESDWNKSNFLSLEVPFRYRLKFKSGISGKFGSFSLDMPYYSDPWIERDFLNRAEDMDWVNMIQQGASFELEETSDNQLSPYNWSFSGQLGASFIPGKAPYINISINPFSSSIGFNSKIKTGMESGSWESYSPSRGFFYPDSATLISTGFSLSGTPLTLGGQKPVNTNPWTPDKQDPEKTDPFARIGIPVSPWEAEKPEPSQDGKNTITLAPPALSQRFESRKASTNQFSFSYRIAPTIAIAQQFDSQKWEKFEDIDWNKRDSVTMATGGSADTTLSMNHSGGLYSGSFSYSGNASWREYLYINEEKYAPNPDTPEVNPINDLKVQQYKSNTYFSTSYALATSVSPFFLSNVWKNTSLKYSLRGLAVKSGEFIGNADEPEWKIEYGEWKKEKVDTHQLSANISANIMDKAQTLSLTAHLPPTDERYTLNAGLRVWVYTASVNWGVKNLVKKDKNDTNTEEGWRYDPITWNNNIVLGTLGSLTCNVNLNTKENLKPVNNDNINNEYEFTSITSNLALSKIGLSAGFTATRTAGYKIGGQGQGWVTSTDDPVITPQTFNISYTLPSTMNSFHVFLFNKRLNFNYGVTSRLNFSLLKYSESSFTFNMSFGVTIAHFLNLTISYNSLNSVIYRYYRELLPDDLPDYIRNDEGPQYNVFTDLLNSFRFDDENLRRMSGFKMKNFTLNMTHFLGDWDAVMRLSISPYLHEREYKMNTEFSFLVQWKPISEFKTDMSYNKRDDKWIVK